jgi:hypothetical protein
VFVFIAHSLNFSKNLQRALAILHAVGNIHAKTLSTYIDEVRISLEEAKDNVKFLGTIRNSTNLLVMSL